MQIFQRFFVFFSGKKNEFSGFLHDKAYILRNLQEKKEAHHNKIWGFKESKNNKLNDILSKKEHKNKRKSVGGKIKKFIHPVYRASSQYNNPPVSSH